MAADEAGARAMTDEVWGGGTIHRGRADRSRLSVRLNCNGTDSRVICGTFAHGYCYVLQGHYVLFQGRVQRSDYNVDAPTRFTEGAARYFSQLYLDDRGLVSYSEARPGRVVFATNSEVLLKDGASGIADGAIYLLGLLATERWVGKSGKPALVEYYRQRTSSASQSAAFEATFGISLDDFYAEFEAWRGDGFPAQE